MLGPPRKRALDGQAEHLERRPDEPRVTSRAEDGSRAAKVWHEPSTVGGAQRRHLPPTRLRREPKGQSGRTYAKARHAGRGIVGGRSGARCRADRFGRGDHRQAVVPRRPLGAPAGRQHRGGGGAAERALKAAGSDKTVRVEVFEGPATGYDADALDILKAFAVNKGPDLYVAAHEWIGEFAEVRLRDGHGEVRQGQPVGFGDVIPVLWDSTKYKGKIYAIPQDSEIRMFFYNKDMLRKIGKDEAFIEGLPGQVDKGEFTMAATSRKLAKEVVDKGARRDRHHPPAQCRARLSDGLRQPSAPSSWTRADRQAAAAQGRDEAALEWFAWNAKNGVTPKNNTAMSWDEIQGGVQDREGLHLSPGRLGGEGMDARRRQGRQLAERQGELLQEDRLDSPRRPRTKGGEPTNLSHPIVYVVNPKSAHARSRGHARGLRHVALLQRPARRRRRRTRRSPTASAACRTMRTPGICRRRRRCWRAPPSSRTIRISAATTASCSRRSRASRPAG